jgi:hypothetical protein
MGTMTYRISRHATDEMIRRNITDSELDAAMIQVGTTSRDGLEVRQAIVNSYLIRAIVNPATDPETVVTVYRTSKLTKYGATP